MKIFALNTDKEALIKSFCHEERGECVVHMTYYHGMSFLLAIIREICLTIIFITIAILAFVYDWPVGWILPTLGAFWMVFVFFPLLKAWIDWNFDFILLTTDKLILVDQTSVIKREVKPIHLENVGGVSTETQFLGLFSFGTLRIHVKEGDGGIDIVKHYVPHASKLASQISEVVTHYQRHYG